MAEDNVTPSEVASPPNLERPAKPLLRHWSRFEVAIDKAALGGHPVRRYAEQVVDIVEGVAVVLELITDDGVKQDLRDGFTDGREDERPLLSATEMGALQRLARTSLLQLSAETYKIMEWAYELHTPEGRAQGVQEAHAKVAEAGRG